MNSQFAIIRLSQLKPVIRYGHDLSVGLYKFVCTCKFDTRCYTRTCTSYRSIERTEFQSVFVVI